MSGRVLPSGVQLTIERFVAVYPVPQIAPGEDLEGAFFDRCRLWMTRLAEQVKFEHPRPLGPNSEYGVKAASPDRPQSKDALACRSTQFTLEGWDLLLRTGTGFPVLNLDATSEEIGDQHFIGVAPRDHVGVHEPVPVPVPPGPPTPPAPTPDPGIPTPTPVPAPDLTEVVERLDKLIEQIDKAHERLNAIEDAQKAPRSISLKGSLWGGASGTLAGL